MSITDAPVWDNSNIYLSIEDTKITEDLDTAQNLISSLLKECELIALKLARINDLDQEQTNELIKLADNTYKKESDIFIILQSIIRFSNCLMSQNSKDYEAMKVSSLASGLYSELKKVMTPFYSMIKLVDDKLFDQLIKSENLKDSSFLLGKNRALRDFNLSVESEKILEGLSANGLHSWGKLYRSIAGSLECDIDGKKVPNTSAIGMLSTDDRQKRKEVWQSLYDAWSAQKDTCAAILNSINGWRLEVAKHRSHTKDFHYLDKATHQSNITRKTLDALMETTYKNRSIGQRAMKAMGRALKVDDLGAWDFAAPAPVVKENSKIYSFKEAMNIVEKSFSDFDPQMGEFARMMADKGWIDGKISENRGPGAYCTGFASTREPRVFLTYSGTLGDIITLAHELGHAYHNWVMRDLPLSQLSYPMTLAETASIFAETLVRDYLFENATSDEKLQIAWQDAKSAVGMICNIPSRYEFEKNMVEARKERALTSQELCDLMDEAWSKWFEDSLTKYDNMFWANKLHFSITEIGFYNYPYLFGMLFSLGIYSQKDEYKDKFKKLYVDVLRDTGSMSAEDLIKKHFDSDIETPEFWQNSLDILEKSVSRFEQLI